MKISDDLKRISFRGALTIWTATLLMGMATKPIAVSFLGILFVLGNIVNTWLAYFAGIQRGRRDKHEK